MRAFKEVKQMKVIRPAVQPTAITTGRVSKSVPGSLS
ncbi:hypothetical protein J2T20_005210 [Paenibacillus wynnii]|nr:hypothetical protein [Paenibacillus wynnii]